MGGTRRWRKADGWVLLAGAGLIAAIAWLDWWIVGEIPLGFLYIVPMMLLGRVFGAWQLGLAALVCTALAESYDDLQWSLRAGVLRDILYLLAFLGSSLYVRETQLSRARALRHMEELGAESDARKAAEEQLRVLVETSPAAIVLTDERGAVLMANEAAHSMLGVSPGGLPGREVQRYVPALTNIAASLELHRCFRSVMEARGVREGGESFVAEICFSSYRTEAGYRLAALLIDSTEERRDQEFAGLRQLLAGSRLAISAVSHEVQNICAAMAGVQQNLAARCGELAPAELEALRALVGALERIAGMSLRQSLAEAEELDVHEVMDEVGIVVRPLLEEAGIALVMRAEGELPAVWADRHSLLQVFLNLVTNSVRALAHAEAPEIAMRASLRGRHVVVAVADNGPGVEQPGRLFRPFQDGAEATGLGLYLSRAFMRSFGSELRYVESARGACFEIVLGVAAHG